MKLVSVAVLGVAFIALADGFSMPSTSILEHRSHTYGTLSTSTKSHVLSSLINKRGTGRSGISTAVMMARKPFIAGNWKMNPSTLKEATALAKSVAEKAAPSSDIDVAIFVPHVFVGPVAEVVKGSNIEIGGQNMYIEQKGAYTGAVSGSMLKQVGAEHVLIGHSERRSVFGASDELINRQMHKALASGLSPILCIGETKEEYEDGLNTNICAVQLSKSLRGISKEQMSRVTIAYEPVWAIGTGLVCDANKAQEVHKFIRGHLAKMYDQGVAETVRIQYGGSVTPESVHELMSKPDIDGCLVGGASLDAAKFQRIMNYKTNKASGSPLDSIVAKFQNIINKVPKPERREDTSTLKRNDVKEVLSRAKELEKQALKARKEELKKVPPPSPASTASLAFTTPDGESVEDVLNRVAAMSKGTYVPPPAKNPTPAPTPAPAPQTRPEPVQAVKASPAPEEDIDAILARAAAMAQARERGSSSMNTASAPSRVPVAPAPARAPAQMSDVNEVLARSRAMEMERSNTYQIAEPVRTSTAQNFSGDTVSEILARAAAMAEMKKK